MLINRADSHLPGARFVGQLLALNRFLLISVTIALTYCGRYGEKPSLYGYIARQSEDFDTKDITLETCQKMKSASEECHAIAVTNDRLTVRLVSI
jgi:hypothetical protein